jgi:hypothetical protein
MLYRKLVAAVAQSAARVVRARPVMVLSSGALLAMLLFSMPLAADEPPNVMRVEEDWEVVLNEPNLDMDAPQFHTVCAPFSNLDFFYLQVCWNYREQSEFAAGGLQLIAWAGDWCVGQKSYREDGLSTTAETITWTQAINTNGNVLTFEVLNGCSQTWGSFGGSETSLSGHVGIPDLNAYSTDFSVSNSWVSYGANRVNLLRIKEVRRYDGEGHLVSRDQTPRIVYELQ